MKITVEYQDGDKTPEGLLYEARKELYEQSIKENASIILGKILFYLGAIDYRNISPEYAVAAAQKWLERFEPKEPSK
jgi:hypothetical protein